MKLFLKLLVFVALGVALGLALRAGAPQLSNFIADQSGSSTTTPLDRVAVSSTPLVERIRNITEQPEPLVIKDTIIQGTPVTALTLDGVFRLGNAERSKANVSPLARNNLLDAAAARKLTDMIDKQYFAHVGPDGKQPHEWVEDVGYDYLTSGENLALGTFVSNADLIDGWMNSPGHRANMLSADYTEIGVAVRRGNFEGDEVWFAVQVFGSPMPDCPDVSEATRISIEALQRNVDTSEVQVEQEKAELDTLYEQKDPEYNDRVEPYNEMIRVHNRLVVTLKEAIATYNAQVTAYNTCIGQ